MKNRACELNEGNLLIFSRSLVIVFNDCLSSREAIILEKKVKEQDAMHVVGID